MKRVGTILLMMMLLIVSVMGCSSQGGGASGGNSGNASNGLQAIKDRGVLRAGVKVDVPNFGYQNPETQEVEGFEIDILKAIAKDLFGDETKIETQAVTAKTRGPLLDSEEVDVIAATFTITEERKLSYNFSTPYYQDTVGLLVKKADGFKSLADLDGKTIGVAQSATTANILKAEAEALGIELKFAEFASYPELKTALLSGRVDAFSVDRSILGGYVDDATEILPDKFSPQDYGLATKLSNKEFAAYLDEFIKEMEASGELAKLIEKWGLAQ